MADAIEQANEYMEAVHADMIKRRGDQMGIKEVTRKVTIIHDQRGDVHGLKLNGRDVSGFIGGAQVEANPGKTKIMVYLSFDEVEWERKDR